MAVSMITMTARSADTLPPRLSDGATPRDRREPKKRVKGGQIRQMSDHIAVQCISRPCHPPVLLGYQHRQMTLVSWYKLLLCTALLATTARAATVEIHACYPDDMVERGFTYLTTLEDRTLQGLDGEVEWPTDGHCTGKRAESTIATIDVRTERDFVARFTVTRLAKDKPVLQESCHVTIENWPAGQDVFKHYWHEQHTVFYDEAGKMVDPSAEHCFVMSCVTV